MKDCINDKGWKKGQWVHVKKVMKAAEIIEILPKTLKEHLNEELYQTDTIGMSGSDILIFEDRVLKIEDVSAETESELKIMNWLSGKLRIPRILAAEQENGKQFILMSKLSGKMACDDWYMDRPETLTSLLAEGLHQLWKVDIRACPVDWSLKNKLEQASFNVVNNLVDLDNVEPDTFGEKSFQNPKELLQWLYDNQPKEELVLSHGDYCLPNVFFDKGEISGFLDLGRCGVADKWCDIAIGYRSLLHNFEGRYDGRKHEGLDMDVFFRKLGLTPDWQKIRYYLLLDELF